MIKHKIRGKVKRSFRDKQVILSQDKLQFHYMKLITGFSEEPSAETEAYEVIFVALTNKTSNIIV
jgi:hypothetical protein